MAGLKRKFSDVFQSYEVDNLYHFGLTTEDELNYFGDVEVVCMMGSADRAKAFAAKLADERGEGKFFEPKNLSKSDRCNLFKVGKVLSLSHGMGNASCSIFLHETAKLLHHAKADFSRVRFIRLGTSGGLGVPAGTVVVADQAVDGTLEFGFEAVGCGKKKRYPAVADKALSQDLVKAGEVASRKLDKNYQVVTGHTVATDCYYEGQGRLDGALPTWYSEEDKMKFLQQARDMGCKNMEMEATVFLSFFQRLGAPATLCNAALLDRLGGDQHVDPPPMIKDYSQRPQEVVMEYLRKEGLL